MPTSRAFFGGSSEVDRLARLAGVLYLIVLPTAGPWFYVSASLLGGDAATIASLQAARTMLEHAIAFGAVGHVVQLVAAVMLYRLLSPFAKLAAMSALVLIAVSVPLSFAAMAKEMEILALAAGGPSASALDAQLLQSEITVAAGAYTSLVNTAVLFWGLWLFPLGWALFRSGLVPRVIGVLVVLGGPFYTMLFFGPLLIAHYQSSLLASIIGFASGIPDVLGELGTALWLTMKGAGGASAPARAATDRT
jgi:hypothetical protein